MQRSTWLQDLVDSRSRLVVKAISMLRRHLFLVPSLRRTFFLLVLALLPILGGCSLLGLGSADPEDFDMHPGVSVKQPAEPQDQEVATKGVQDEPSASRYDADLEPATKAPASRPARDVPAARRLQKPKTAATPQSRSLEQAIADLFGSSALNGGDGLLGVQVVSLEDDTTLFERRPHTPLVPASNMKLFTTAAALEFLSPSFVYETSLEATGMVTPMGLLGDLVIRGSGDPSISARMHDWDPLAVFKGWARQLKDMGIASIEGDLIGDASLFERFVYCPGWDPEDEPIWYAAQTDALSLNENTIKVIVRPGRKTGSPVRVELEPDTSKVQLDNTARTGSRRAANTLQITRRCGTNVIEISGRLPSRFNERVRTLTIDDPAAYFMDVLAQVFAAQGIAVSGRTRVIRQPGGLERGTILFRRTSPPLRELVKETNTESNNFFAEQLLRTIGAHMTGRGTREGGAQVVMSWLQDMGVSREEFVMVDGSGLSRLNYVSPAAVVSLLRHMYQSSNWLTFRSSLPVSGVDGTLRRRMRGTPAQAKVLAKTGYMKGVTSLGGYTESLDGKPLAFSIIYNGRRPSTSYVKSLEDKLCIILRTHEVGMASLPEPADDQALLPPELSQPSQETKTKQRLAPAA